MANKPEITNHSLQVNASCLTMLVWHFREKVISNDESNDNRSW